MTITTNTVIVSNTNYPACQTELKPAFDMSTEAENANLKIVYQSSATCRKNARNHTLIVFSPNMLMYASLRN